MVMSSNKKMMCLIREPDGGGKQETILALSLSQYKARNPVLTDCIKCFQDADQSSVRPVGPERRQDELANSRHLGVCGKLSNSHYNTLQHSMHARISFFYERNREISRVDKPGVIPIPFCLFCAS